MSRTKNTNTLHSLYAEVFKFSPKKGDLRRISILESTLELIAKDGVEAVSFESVGKRSGINRAHVAYYFPDQTEMIESAVRFAISTAQTITVNRVKAAKDAQGALEAFIDGTFEWLETYPLHARVVLYFYYVASYRKKIKALHSEAREMGYLRIKSILQSIAPRKSSASLTPMAKAIQNLLTGTLVEYVTTDSEQSPAQIREFTKQLILRIVLNINSQV